MTVIDLDFLARVRENKNSGNAGNVLELSGQEKIPPGYLKKLPENQNSIRIGVK